VLEQAPHQPRCVVLVVVARGSMQRGLAVSVLMIDHFYYSLVVFAAVLVFAVAVLMKQVLNDGDSPLTADGVMKYGITILVGSDDPVGMLVQKTLHSFDVATLGGFVEL